MPKMFFSLRAQQVLPPILHLHDLWPSLVGKSRDRSYGNLPRRIALAWLSQVAFEEVLRSGGRDFRFSECERCKPIPLAEIGQTGLAKPYAFRADEYGPRTGRLHLHALIGNVRHLEIYCGQKLPPNTWGQRCCWLHRWFCGHARIFPYDPTEGARFYLSKYVVKGLAEYEFIGFEDGNLRFSAKGKPK
jgi:hypothetical protein